MFDTTFALQFSNTCLWIITLFRLILLNPIPASTSASTSKNAADVEAVSLKFDAQLSVGVIL